MTEEGARRRYPDGIPPKVRAALDHEFALIAELDYAPYFLTVHDIVRFARSKEHPVPGPRLGGEFGGLLLPRRHRGRSRRASICCSSASSRPSAREPPDIDVDFEHERREEVIQYIYGRYGRHRAGLAATVICYRARSAIREVGKAFGLSDDTVGALAGMLWGWSTQAVSEKDARRVGLDPTDPHLARVLALARELIGFPRHLSQHVGGFVITRGRLDEVVPIENAAMEDRTCVEWDKDDLDALGILKIDVLALGMLTCLQRGFDLLNKHYVRSHALPRAARAGRGSPRHSARTGRGLPPQAGEGEWRASQDSSLAAIPPEEPAVYACCRAPIRSACSRSRAAPRCRCCRGSGRKTFYDLVIEVAIVRPGPIQGDMVHPYLRRRQGVEKVRVSLAGAPLRPDPTSCSRCSARRWACRCSRSRRCASRSSPPASRRPRPTSCAAPWRRSAASAPSSISATS